MEELHTDKSFPNFLELDYNSDGNVYLQCYKPTSEQQSKSWKTIQRIAVIALLSISIVAATCLTIGLGVGLITLMQGNALILSLQVTSSIIKKIFLRKIGIILLGSVISGSIGTFILHLFRIKKSYQLNEKREQQDSSNPIASQVTSKIGRAIQRSIPSSDIDILCPITDEVILFPVDLGCGNKATTHIFEYSALVKSLTKKQICPICQTPKKISDIRRNRQREEEITKIAHRMFIKIEELLQSLPHNIFLIETGDDNDATLREQVRKEIEIGSMLFENLTDDGIHYKISNPEFLTSNEIYTLGYHLVQQFKPLLSIINRINRDAYDFLSVLRDADQIDLDVYEEQVKYLGRWRTDKKQSLFPPECKSLAKIADLF